MTNNIGEKVKKLRLSETSHHIFICGGGEAAGKCCSSQVGQQAWDELKAEIEALQKNNPSLVIQRSKVSCLRVCQSGPIAVVYPQGLWYRDCSGENLKKVVRKLADSEPVPELQLAVSGDKNS